MTRREPSIFQHRKPTHRLPTLLIIKFEYMTNNNAHLHGTIFASAKLVDESDNNPNC